MMFKMNHEITYTRFNNNPLITYSHQGLQGEIGENINGPSIIKVPGWVKNPLGKYYMYFAHHKGNFIRLAYSDNIHGPWKIYEKGTLSIAQTPGNDHIASPDVHVDEKAGKIVMLYHTKYKNSGAFSNFLQVTFLAISDDGINFTSDKNVLGPYYMRLFEYKGRYYAIAKSKNASGVLLTSPRYTNKFSVIREIIPRMRHCAVYMRGNKLFIFFSRKGDAPESLYYSTINLDKHPNYWHPEKPKLLMKPEYEYEGASENITPSKPGPIFQKSNQLRDPAIFEEENEVYLFYTIAGEKGIAGAKLIFND